MWTDNLKHFHFWCQKVLPLVYDDSLSYYEVLCKVTDHLNELTTLVNEIGDELERYEGVTDTRLDNLETWRAEVDTWRANIDTWQGQINSWKSEIDTWKNDIDEWKTTVSNWITNTVTPFITNMTERVEDIEATVSALESTVELQAERSTKIIPVTLHYDTSNNQFYLQEVITPLSGGRYPFENYLTSRSLDTDAVTNGANLVFSIRDFYVGASTKDNQFPPASMTTATAKTVKIKKATLHGGGYVQYNGQDVYFELDVQNIQTIYDPMDFFSPLLMYAPKTNTDDRPHRIVWLPRDQYIIGTADRISVVEQRETALDRAKTMIVVGDLIYDSSNDRLTLRLEADTNFPSYDLDNVNVGLCTHMQNVLYSIFVGDDAIKQSVGYVPLADLNDRIYIVNNQGSSYVYENQDVYMLLSGINNIIGSVVFYASPSGYGNMIYSRISSIIKEEVGYNLDYPQLKLGNNLSIRQDGSTSYLDAVTRHNYSVNEQVVGIWIDGKPLYEVTLTGITDSTDPINNISHGIANIKLVTNISGVVDRGDGVSCTVNFPRSGNTIWCQCDATILSLVGYNTSEFLGRNYYITIRYTKTTD